jgi:glycosyltransferase involved in cell wall biosynthesis
MISLSIITVNLNNKKGLNRTIESVIIQSFLNIQYIVIDGGSVDGSLQIIKEHTSHIFYWISEKDTGVYNAMNKGIAAATGDYLLFLNSGDVLSNEHTISEMLKR